jgi:peptidoglycan/xylan/chitin deacetylase (PgdA/CDA1 family)
MYHKTGAFLDTDGTLWYPSNYWVSGLQLESELFYLRANGYPLISLDEVVRYVRGEQTLPTIAVAMTVDDGFKNNLQCALPVLMLEGAHAGFSIITDRVSETEALRQTEEWDFTYPADYLIWPEVEALAAADMTIISHSRSHPLLTRLHGANLTDEVSGSRDVLETRLGQPITLFAYPRGAYDQRVLDAVQAAGYEAAVSSDSEINRPGQNLLVLQRVFVPGGISVAAFSNLTSDSGELLFPGQVPLPAPRVVSVVGPEQTGVGMPFTLEVTADNQAAPASRGYLIISFPDAPAGPADVSLQIMETDTPGSRIRWPGDSILHRQGYSMSAVHPMVEFEDSDQYSDYAQTMDYDYWRSGERHAAKLRVTVRRPGPFRLWVRMAMVSADHDQAVISPESGVHDQQDWPVYEYVINAANLDLSPPAVTIQSPASDSVVRGAVAVMADATDAMSGVTSVIFKLDGSPVATDTAPPYEWNWDTSVSGDGQHTLVARALDNAGNSSEATVTVTVDNSPPDVAIANPTSGSVVKGAVAVRADAADAVSGINSVIFKLDGSPVATDTVPPYEWSWDTSVSDDGQHTLVARALDNAGNSSEATVTVTVDNSPPDVAIANPTSGSVVKGAVAVRADAADAVSGISSVIFKLDGGPAATDTTPPYEWNWDTSVSDDGAHTLVARALDNAGNSSQAAVTVTVDNTTFDDVLKSNLFWRYIEASFAAAITNGCSSSPPLYCPSDSVTRGQMAKFLCKAAQTTWFDPGSAHFTDVPRGANGAWDGGGSGDLDADGTHVFYGWIERLANPASWAGTPPTSGCGGGKYCPEQTVTRDQMAKFLCAATGRTPFNRPAPTFADVPAANPFYGWIERLADAGFWGGTAPTSGCTPTTYCPSRSVTRGQMAKFLVLAFGLPYYQGP